jgi:predicted unusual protein kinase regulating ubiquinone biosynthesis (AarF/ABC1/UbiB family)
MLIKQIPTQLFRWQRAQSSPFARQLEIFKIAVNFSFFLIWDKSVQNLTSSQRHRRAQWLVNHLLDLGPTFIKIGQSLSTRADLIPSEYIEALSQLQDRVPPFSSQEAIAVIEQEFQRSVKDLFQSFEMIPLASASLGQVHRATLHSGEEVVVKVQRPGLEKLLKLDFEVLRQLIRFGKRWLPGFKKATQKYEVEAIYQEFFGLLFQEIDYINEGQNADRFRKNFQDYPGIKVPNIHWDYTTQKVLTLEYLPGIKVDDRASLAAEGINLDKVIEKGICAYLKQLLLDGFFQSDPHPGNMAVNLEGELIFYDFGTMAEVKTIAKDQMIQTFFAILKKDVDKVLETLIFMGLVESKGDLRSVKRIVIFLLDNFREKPVDVRAFEQISDEVYLMFQQQPFRLPPQMTFILKSIMTLDGIARALDPQYNLIAASQPFIQSVAVDKKTGTLWSSLAKQAQALIIQGWNRPNRTERLLQNLEDKIERGELKVRIRSLESDRLLKNIHLAIKSLIYACLTGFTLLSATILLSTIYFKFAIAGFGLAGLFSLLLIRSLIKLAIQEKIDNMISK